MQQLWPAIALVCFALCAVALIATIRLRGASGASRRSISGSPLVDRLVLVLGFGLLGLSVLLTGLGGGSSLVAGLSGWMGKLVFLVPLLSRAILMRPPRAGQ